MLVLYQAEWCPYSHRVRMALTELGLEWLARPQPVERADRDAMEEATGTRSIPTLADGDRVVSGAAEIVDHLRRRYGEPGDAGRHRAMMRKEWPHWVELHGDASDGTRASVVKELFRTRVRDGLIGDFGFDPAGDMNPAFFGLYRFRDRAHRLVELIRAPSSLVRPER